MIRRRLAAGLVCCLLLFAPAHADEATLQRIAGMESKALAEFAAVVGATVAQDTLQMRDAALTRDCLALIGLTNAFALGHEYLGAAMQAARKREQDVIAAGVYIEAVHSRVLAFAARVQGLSYMPGCRNFTVPAEHAADARYAPVVALVPADFNAAVADLRTASDALVVRAAAAATAKQCPLLVRAAQGINLFVPYIEKLDSDIAERPELLGPFTSRRGLAQIRSKLDTALAGLDREHAALCRPAGQ